MPSIRFYSMILPHQQSQILVQPLPGVRRPAPRAVVVHAAVA